MNQKKPVICIYYFIYSVRFILFTFYTWENRGSGKLSKLLKPCSEAISLNSKYILVTAICTTSERPLLNSSPASEMDYLSNLGQISFLQNPQYYQLQNRDSLDLQTVQWGHRTPWRTPWRCLMV